MQTWTSLALRLTARAAVNPRVAADLVSMAWAMRRRGWYRHAPFLPVPPAEYLRWRMYTAYGEERAVPTVAEVLRFARWRRHLMRV